MSYTREWLSSAFKSIEELASSGHYLDRIIAIVDIMGLDKYSKLLRANRDFLEVSSKPAGLDELIEYVSDLILVLALDAGCDANDLKPIAWGVDIGALTRRDVLDARQRGAK